MYKAVFNVPLGGNAAEPLRAYLSLPGWMCNTLLKNVDSLKMGEGLELVLPNQVVDFNGDALSSKLRWSQQALGFVLLVKGCRAGLVLIDELEAALGVPHAFGVMASVCDLAFDIGGVNVWRKGLFDPSSGTIKALTVQSSLSFLPVTAYVAPRLSSTMHEIDTLVGFNLAPTEIGSDFQLTTSQSRWLDAQSSDGQSRSAGGFDPMLDLREFSDSVKSFLASDIAVPG